MNDEERLNEELREANAARIVLESPAFQKAFSRIESALLSGMRNAAIADDKLRLRLLDKYEALHDLKDQLQSDVTTGKLAEEEIRQKTLWDKTKEVLFN